MQTVMKNLFRWETTMLFANRLQVYSERISELLNVLVSEKKKETTQIELVKSIRVSNIIYCSFDAKNMHNLNWLACSAAPIRS